MAPKNRTTPANNELPGRKSLKERLQKATGLIIIVICKSLPFFHEVKLSPSEVLTSCVFLSFVVFIVVIILIAGGVAIGISVQKSSAKNEIPKEKVFYSVSTSLIFI